MAFEPHSYFTSGNIWMKSFIVSVVQIMYQPRAKQSLEDAFRVHKVPHTQLVEGIK